MSSSTPELTPKQQHYLTLLNQAASEQISVLQLAKQHNIDPSLLYAARKTLRQKGALPQPDSKFQSVTLPQPSDQTIELKTQLPNGQPIWLSISPSQLPATLRALSS